MGTYGRIGAAKKWVGLVKWSMNDSPGAKVCHKNKFNGAAWYII